MADLKKNKDINTLSNIISSVNQKVSSQYSNAFGENFINVDKDSRKAMVRSISTAAFGKALHAENAKAGFANNTAINSGAGVQLLDDLRNELISRGENVVLNSSSLNAGSTFSHTLTPEKQLQLVALVPQVIQPIYNKVIKSVVAPMPHYYRSVEEAQVKDREGNVYNYFDLVNDGKKLLEISNGGQPTLTKEVAIVNGIAKENLCNVYNTLMLAKYPSYKSVKSVYDFIQKGVKITDVTIDGKKHAVQWMSTGDATQSGEVLAKAATIDLKVVNSDDPTKFVYLFGRIEADGTTIINVSTSGQDLTADKVTAVTFEFFVPSKGAQNPLSIVRVKTVMKHPITQKATFDTSLNQQLLDDSKNILGIDIVEEFQKSSVELMNQHKDDYFLNKLESNQKEVAKLVQEAEAGGYKNFETVQGRNTGFAHKTIDMNVFDAGFANVLEKGNMGLAYGMQEICVKLDETLKPTQKRFSILSSPRASKWVNQANGKSPMSINIVGTVNEGGEIAGFSTPFVLQEVNLGSGYTGRYIVSHKLRDHTTTVKTKFGTPGVDVPVEKHKFSVIPQFEEQLDSMVFVHGVEYVTEGVGHDEYYKDKTLQLESRFECITYNGSLGVLELIDAPTHKTPTI